jgi:hypothetical protein
MKCGMNWPKPHRPLSYVRNQPVMVNTREHTRPFIQTKQELIILRKAFVSRRSALDQMKGAKRESVPRATLGLLLMGIAEVDTTS